MPLRLKSLELHGYKTFATRTFFEFAPGITAVVGPNGAGKSNVADALRWVLGEQSYTLLRGKKTEDMIFSGSEHRPRAGMASAEVTFDNSARWLPVDFSEVAMTRRAYRDGHNDYLLNSQHVRLRDMNEMLAAAGLSERTYTMVGQGLVDASLALKADERRRLFEEAAGVGLYRVRREEALKRLETTLHNRERVQDILAEIEPRLKTLERQAKRANEYAAAQADLREVLKEWYGFHWYKLQQELQEAQDNVKLHQSRAQAAREILAANQSRHAELRERMAAIRELLGELHRESATQHQDREAAALSMAVVEERRRSLSHSLEVLKLEQAGLESERALAAQRLQELEQEAGRAQQEAAEAAEQLKLAQAALEEQQSGRGMIEERLRQARDRQVGLQASRAEAQARLDALTAQIEYHSAQIVAAAEAVRSAEEAKTLAEEALKMASLKRAAAEQATQESQAEIEAARKALLECQMQARKAQAETEALFANRARLGAQLEILKQAEETLSGYAEGARFLLDPSRQGRLKILGPLSARLQLPVELETAIAAALGDAVDTVVLDATDLGPALDSLDNEDAGRAVMLPLEERSPQVSHEIRDPEVLGAASKLVRPAPDVRAAVEALLGNTYIVRTRAAALRLRSQLAPQTRLVTLRGEVFRGDGLVLAGRAPASAILSRPRQRRELESSVTDLDDRLLRQEEFARQTAAKAEAVAAEVLDHEARLEASRKTLIDLQATEHSAQLDLERQGRMIEWHAGRLHEFEREQAVASSNQLEIQASIRDLDVAASAAADALAQLTSELNAQNLDEAQELATYWSMRDAVALQAADAARLRLREHSVAVEKLLRQTEDQQKRLEEQELGLRQLEDERLALLDREHGVQEEATALEARIAPLESELQALQSEEAKLEESELSAQQASTSAERTLTQFEIDQVRRQEALQSLRGRIVDDFGLVAFEYAASIEGPVPLPFEGLVEQLRNVPELSPELEDQLNQRRARLRRLGLINPEAAQDYETESTRYSFLSAQILDLRQAEADLRQVIAELDELTRQEFSRTYAAVDKQFRSIFTRLFGGGSAHLALTDPTNLVETGIEIEARLPGRREQGLSLLSGGERSLTAIALVFALLKVSPTPVCVLDEVDAMLDEANVGRFRDLLAELSQQTQFIVITHNRNTVQAADYIYGVTMGRDSTSQIISLRLDEVSEEMLGTSRV